MANRDIAGLLTGVSSQPLSPLGNLSREQQYMELGRRASNRMQGGIRGMMGQGDTPQDQIAMAASQLDQSNPDDLIKLSKLMQVRGDSAGAARTIKAAQDLKKEASVRQSLIGIAESQGNTEILDFLEGGGDLATAQSVLFRAGRAPKTASLTSSEVDEYDLYMGDYTEKELLAVGAREKGKLYGTNINEDGVKKLMLKAEYIYTAGQAATREDALRMVIKGIVPKQTQTQTPTQGGGTSKDPYANIRG